MQSYLEKYIQQLIEEQGSSYFSEDVLSDILIFLTDDVIPDTGNYFDELVRIAEMTKYIDNPPAQQFRNALYMKIAEERDVDGAGLLIKKFL